MITDKIKELEAAKANVATLEAAISTQRNADLASLPSQYGFDGVDSFIEAVRNAGGKRRGRKPGKMGSAAKAAPSGKRTRRRARITDAMRAEVKKLLGSGKTGAQIAKTVGISLPSVQNIKSALGLVNKRS